jgi:hypothetical protein
MKNIAITRTKNTVSATYLPYTSYKRAIELATALKGKIGTTAEGNFKATFNSVKTAEKFATTWRAEYNANRKVSVEPTAPITKKPKVSKGKTELTELEIAHAELFYAYEAACAEIEDLKAQLSKKTPSSTKKTDTKKATAPKKSTTSSKKTTPRKTKGSAFDFGKIKGKTDSDKNKALHATLVAMGHADSRTKDYQAIWNARPWAK